MSLKVLLALALSASNFQQPLHGLHKIPWIFLPETEGLPREQLGSIHFSNRFMKPHSCTYERCM